MDVSGAKPVLLVERFPQEAFDSTNEQDRPATMYRNSTGPFLACNWAVLDLSIAQRTAQPIFMGLPAAFLLVITGGEAGRRPITSGEARQQSSGIDQRGGGRFIIVL